MQIVPDPRPPATFAQLERTLTTARTAAAGGLAGRWRRGDRSETLAELARMRRRAVGDDARELAYRLERRLRYAGVAGGR